MRDADHGAYGVEGREELICAYHFGGMGVKSAGWGGWFTAYVLVPRERERGWASIKARGILFHVFAIWLILLRRYL